MSAGSNAEKRCRQNVAKARGTAKKDRQGRRERDEGYIVNSTFKELVSSAFLVVAALFPIVNPLGSAPIFLILTRGLSEQARARLARSIAVNGLGLMVTSIFIGTTYSVSSGFHSL